MPRQDDQAWGELRCRVRLRPATYCSERREARTSQSRRLDTWEWVIAVSVFVASAVVTFLFVLSIG